MALSCKPCIPLPSSLPQPALFFPHSAIRSVELMRAGGGSATFDLVLHLRDGGVQEFGMLPREEVAAIEGARACAERHKRHHGAGKATRRSRRAPWPSRPPSTPVAACALALTWRPPPLQTTCAGAGWQWALQQLQMRSRARRAAAARSLKQLTRMTQRCGKRRLCAFTQSLRMGARAACWATCARSVSVLPGAHPSLLPLVWRCFPVQDEDFNPSSSSDKEEGGAGKRKRSAADGTEARASAGGADVEGKDGEEEGSDAAGEESSVDDCSSSSSDDDDDGSVELVSEDDFSRGALESMLAEEEESGGGRRTKRQKT